jgi:predicted methyltransferase
MTQKQEVLNYMRRHGSITPIQAFKHLGITKLATVVSDLRLKDGVEIEKETVKVKTRYGKTLIKKYSLKETENV